MPPTPLQPPPHSSPFLTKKSSILSSLATATNPEYSDKSPKGSIDVQIIDLIDEINAFDGYVTTSSCAGRVAVFVEGRKRGGAGGGGGGEREDGNDDDYETMDAKPSNGALNAATTISTGAGPGGKGYGNKWLYVSHELVPSALSCSSQSTTTTTISTTTYYHDLFNLTPSSSTTYPYPSNPRLIKLTFSPLILHILCSSLHTAKPLLAAAINAGFRESGVQSLKSLDQDQSQSHSQNGEAGAGAGVMVAVRTAGCGFESVVGYVEEREDGTEIYRSVVSEEWLGVLVGVVTGRFEENVGRRERFRGALRDVVGGGGRDGKVGGEGGEWEDKEVRRRRKREEGLRIKREKEREEKQDGDGGSGAVNVEGNDADDGDGLGGGLFLDST